jgi:hypothetical protein
MQCSIVKGMKFCQLTVLKRVGSDRNKNVLWSCLCTCGKTTVVPSAHLRSTNTKSCGCLKHASINKKHGHTASGKVSGTWHSWHSMVQRCTNHNRVGFKYYGEKGVKVCKRWLHSFPTFLKDMGERPSGTTLSRLKDMGDYKPSNCAWHTRHQQSQEHKRKTN